MRSKVDYTVELWEKLLCWAAQEVELPSLTVGLLSKAAGQYCGRVTLENLYHASCEHSYSLMRHSSLTVIKVFGKHIGLQHKTSSCALPDLCQDELGH